jgi:DNA-directed RNA polymerase specialized sigma24 family protein
VDLDVHLEAIAAGDADAFGRWVTAAEVPLRRSLASFARTVDTESVLQEGLLRAWQIAPRVRPDGAGNSLLRMAIRITRNYAVSEVRRQRRAEARSELAEPPVAPPVPPDPLLRETISACCDKLPAAPKKALAIRLAARGGASDRQLAARARQSIDAFLKAVSRARAMLAECLRRNGVDLEASG